MYVTKQLSAINEGNDLGIFNFPDTATGIQNGHVSVEEVSAVFPNINDLDKFRPFTYSIEMIKKLGIFRASLSSKLLTSSNPLKK